MRRLSVLIALILISLTLSPVSSALVPDDLLDLKSLTPGYIKSGGSITVQAETLNPNIDVVELWLSAQPITDLFAIEQNVLPITQAIVKNKKVVLTKSQMPVLTDGVYQLVLRSIDGTKVIGEQAVPLVVANTALKPRPAVFLIPIALPPTNSAASSFRPLLNAVEKRSVSLVVDGQVVSNLDPVIDQDILSALQSNPAGVVGLGYANVDADSLTKSQLGSLVAVSSSKTQAILAKSQIEPKLMALWPSRGVLSSAGFELVAKNAVDLIVTSSENRSGLVNVATKSKTKLTAAIAQAQVTSALETIANPVELRQHLIAGSTVNSDVFVLAAPLGWVPSYQAAMTAVSIFDLPWLDLKPVYELTSLAKDGVAPGFELERKTFSNTHLKSLALANNKYRDLVATTDENDSSQLTAAFEILSSASTWWWKARSSGVLFSEATAQAIAKQSNALQVVARNKIVLPDKTGSVPITIVNDRTTDAKLKIAGRSINTSVVRIEPVVVTVPKNRKTVIELPIEVVSGAQSLVEIVITSPQNEPTTLPSSIIRIEVSSYGNTAKFILFGAFGVLLILSLISIINRVRNRKTNADALASDTRGGL